MDISSTVIKLVRIDEKSKPIYSITIKGDKTVEYKGIKKGSKSNFTEKIREDEFLDFLSNIKDSGFFSIENNFLIDKNKPTTEISFNFVDERGILKKKSIIHNSSDPKVPLSLKKFEDKIDDFVGPKKALGNNSEKLLKTNNKADNTSFFKKNKKPFVGVIVLFLAIILVMSLFMNGFFNQSGDELNDTVKNISILDFSTFSLNSNQDNYESEKVFEKGDSIYFHTSLSNINNKSNYNLNFKINVSNNGKPYFSDSIDKNMFDKTFFEYIINTDESWKVGNYSAEITVTDLDSKKEFFKTTDFSLTLDKIGILVLTTASKVTKYQDYNIEKTFKQDDSFYVYVEYSDIETKYENTTCSLNLTLSISKESKEYFNETKHKITVGNNSHAWRIPTDIDWVTGEYLVNFTITDLLSNQSVSSETEFSLLENKPEILVLTTAGNIIKYQDYSEEDTFNLNDSFYVYCEYNNINTINNNSYCSLYLSLNISIDSNEYYNKTTYKTKVENNSHAWEIITDSTWNIGEYTADLTITDLFTSQTNSSKCYFTII